MDCYHPYRYYYIGTSGDGCYSCSSQLAAQAGIHEEVAGYQEEVGCHPGQRVAETYAQEVEGGHQPEAHAATRYHLHDTTHHAQVTIAHSLDRIAEDAEHAEYRVEVVVYPHEQGGIGYYLALASVDEESHHIVGKGEYGGKGEYRVH